MAEPYHGFLVSSYLQTTQRWWLSPVLGNRVREKKCGRTWEKAKIWWWKGSGCTIEVVSFFNYLENCFNKEGGLQYDVELRLGKGLKTFGAMKLMFDVKLVNFCVNNKKNSSHEW